MMPRKDVAGALQGDKFTAEWLESTPPIGCTAHRCAYHRLDYAQ